jgi:hypothetical protein
MMLVLATGWLIQFQRDFSAFSKQVALRVLPCGSTAEA